MRFGPWTPLALAALDMSEEPGIFQVRVADGVLAYPRGRSAMIHYGGGASLRAAVAAFAAAHPGAPWLCRAALGWRGEREAALDRLIEEFRERFGERPHPP